MAAPSGTVWGSIAGGYGRIGIYIKLTSTATQTARHLEIWFWSKYSVSDTSNTLYSDDDTTTATTSRGSKTIKTTVDSGSGWSTSNQVKLAEFDRTFTRGTSADKRNHAAKLINVDRVGATMTVTTSYTIPALAKYTVSYNANGGSGAPSAQTKYHGKSLTLSSTKPTRTGYTFLGWSTSSSATSATYSAGGSYTANATDTLYAVWKANTLTIKYHINGGTINSDDYYASSSIVYKKSNSAVVTSVGKYNNPISSTYGLSDASTFGLSRTGYNFKGWKVGSSGTTVFAQNDTSIVPTDLTSSIKTGDCTITLYAVWELKTYTVSYNANGGSGAPSNQTKNHGQTLTLSSTKPTRSGYTFMGWGTSASDTSVDYSAGGSYTANAGITLYAIWEKTITLTYNENGGSGAPFIQSVDIYNATTSYKFTISSRKPTRSGYTFLGWSTLKSATSATYSAGDTLTLSENATLYAVWTINSYSLTVNPNGGTWKGAAGNTVIKQNYKTTITLENPTWTGRTFSGWALSGSGSLTGNVYTFEAGAGTLTARWDTNDYLVTFNAGINEGSVNGTSQIQKSIEYGAKIGTLPIAVRKNYTFLGWFTSASGGTQITSDYIVTGNLTVYAQFEIDASAYVNDSDDWKSGVTFVSDAEGNVRKGHAKTNVNGVWKDGYCT